MSEDCIIASGTIDKTTGYIRKSRSNIVKGAHIWAYLDAHGSISKGFHVHHKCHNKVCINPEHLEALSLEQHNAVHTLPMSQETMASLTACKNGHPFDGKTDKQRTCSTCAREANRRWMANNIESERLRKREYARKRRELNYVSN